MRPNASAHDDTDDRTTTRDPRTNERGSDESDADRGLLKGVTAALLGRAGIGALGGTASAAGNSKSLLVFGDGWGKHSYEIAVKGGGSIQRGTHVESNDFIRSTYGSQRAEGELWQWNVDSYAFTGELDEVVLDGSLSVHVPDGAFEAATRIHVDGQSGGSHAYEIDTHSADIDPVPGATVSNDTDEGGNWSERTGTNDRISGTVEDTNRDSHSFGSDDLLQYLAVSEGDVRFSD